MLKNTCDCINVELADGTKLRLFSALQGKRWQAVPPALWHVLHVQEPIAHTPVGVADSSLFVDPATYSLLIGRALQAHARDDGYVVHVSVGAEGSRN